MLVGLSVWTTRKYRWSDGDGAEVFATGSLRDKAELYTAPLKPSLESFQDSRKHDNRQSRSATTCL